MDGSDSAAADSECGVPSPPTGRGPGAAHASRSRDAACRSRSRSCSGPASPLGGWHA